MTARESRRMIEAERERESARERGEGGREREKNSKRIWEKETEGQTLYCYNTVTL